MYPIGILSPLPKSLLQVRNKNKRDITVELHLENPNFGWDLLAPQLCQKKPDLLGSQ